MLAVQGLELLHEIWPSYMVVRLGRENYTGYARTENGKAALELFTQMKWEDTRPNDITFINAVGTCTVEASLSYGKHVHAYALKAGYNSIIIGNALVDMI